MKRRRSRLAVTSLALLATLFGSVQASATPAQPVGIAADIVNVAIAPADGRVNCFGYVGIFKPGTSVMVVNWDTSTLDECFGVSADRTIWHTWPGAGGWVRMPGNGRADDINTVVVEWVNGTRLVSVHVYGSTLWCQYYIGGSGWTGSWFQC